MPTLTPRQLQAASLIASGQSQRQVAKTVGASYQTVNAWAQLPAFRAQVQAILGDAHQSTATMLQGQRLRAIEVLGTLLENAPPAIKLQAVRLILEVTDTPPPTPTTSPVDEFASIMQMLGDGKPGHVYTTAELDAMLQ